MDGVGDNTDAFPNDSTETVDSDNDGVGDNSDAYPNDANGSSDSEDDSDDALPSIGVIASPFDEIFLTNYCNWSYKQQTHWKTNLILIQVWELRIFE